MESAAVTPMVDQQIHLLFTVHYNALSGHRTGPAIEHWSDAAGWGVLQEGRRERTEQCTGPTCPHCTNSLSLARAVRSLYTAVAVGMG